MSDEPRLVYSPRPDTTPETEISTLAAVYAYLINTHDSKKGTECTATSDDRDGSKKIRTQSKEAAMT